MKTDNILKSASFSTSEFSPKVFYLSKDLKIPFIYLEEGQEIAPHKGGATVFYFVDGEGVLTSGSERIGVKKGTLAVVGNVMERGIKCTRRITAYGIHILLDKKAISQTIERIETLAEFSEAKPVSKILYDSEAARLVLFSLKKNQEIKPHSVAPKVIMYLLSGKGFFRLGEIEKEAESGGIALCESMEDHGFRASEDMIILAAVIPRP